jgi:hypothetical protein
MDLNVNFMILLEDKHVTMCDLVESVTEKVHDE